jgi:hypothetical protein
MVMRRGGALSGCLVWMAFLAAAGYVGADVGAPYYRYYRYRDVVSQEAGFAQLHSDEAMRRTIWATADSLGLPEDAYRLNITRDSGRVRVTASYDDAWTIPGYRRVVHFDLDDSSAF